MIVKPHNDDDGGGGGNGSHHNQSFICLYLLTSYFTM
jgi:hypothetical protein